MSDERRMAMRLCTELTVSEVPRHFARIEPDKRALYDGQRVLSYAELDIAADDLARSLVAAGVRRGDVVSAYLPNCIDYVVVVIAVARSAAIFSPINPRYKAFEVGAILKQARPKFVFSTQALSPVLRQAATGLRVIQVDGELLPRADGATLPAVAESDPFSLMFTSGTTGESKGVLATHRARMMWVLNATIQYGLNERDLYLGTMPQVHSAGLTFTLMHLYAGATVRILPQFDAAGFISIVSGEGVTSALTVPTMLAMIVEELDRRASKPTFASLKRLISCGAPLPLNTKKRVLESMSGQLYDYYGSTESNSMTVLRPADQLRKPKSVGQAFRNVELRIVNECGETCPPGVVGEVWCANPSVMTAYLDRPEETARAFTGKWFHTGDLGYLDRDGFLHLVSRRSDVIISGGVNIYPAEIEQVLMLHASILDAAVVGEPDSKWGQRVKAFLVLREGARLTLEEVQAHCTAYLADFKKPRAVVFVSSIPKNAGGKTMKSALLETYDA